MKLPLLLSVPHAGLGVPAEVEPYSNLSSKEIAADGDEGAAEIYLPLKEEVAGFVTTGIARAFVDMNRAEDDRGRDGVVKTHTCWNVPTYEKELPPGIVEMLLHRYHRPYHWRLRVLAAAGVKLGVDCHTMAAHGPPVGPDPGKRRPAVCLSSGGGTLPDDWLEALANCFLEAFGQDVAINDPFPGGHIIREHAKELPWVQVELSRASFMTDPEKGECVFAALGQWVALDL